MGSIANLPLRLPCGLTLKNRLVKSAMSERLAVDGMPTAAHRRVYARWAEGGWGMLVTGNIMVDDRYLGTKADVAVSGSDSAIVEQWTSWVEAARGQGSIIIAQINHPGRQSPIGAGKRGLFSKTLAPSAVPLNLGDNALARIVGAVVFGTPQEMTLAQIEDVIARFTYAANLASRVGFHGVEVHAGHGFLLSQFLSSSANKRSDEFGGSAAKRVEIVLRIIRAIRKEVPASFCVGIKINAADHMNPSGLHDLLQQVSLISKEQIDYVQLSGGTFENPQMLSTKNSMSLDTPPSKRSIDREGFFLQASQDIRRTNKDLVLMVTGGFRSRNGVNSALDSGACDLVGIGRPAIKHPSLPKEIMFKNGISDEEARFDVEPAPSLGWIAKKIRSVGAGAETKYYASLLHKL